MKEAKKKKKNMGNANEMKWKEKKRLIKIG